MKKHVTFLIAILITAISFSQQGINYKAIVKDDLGNVEANNNNVLVQFIILQGVVQTNVYEEIHTTSTDVNGILMVNIGEGTVLSQSLDAFTNIDWSSQDHFLNVQIDTGPGMVDIGTTAFKTVPYAITAANVTGMKQHTWNGNTGWNLIGAFQTGFIGENAIDLSQTSSVFVGARGTSSFAVGISTNALGSKGFTR